MKPEVGDPRRLYDRQSPFKKMMSTAFVIFLFPSCYPPAHPVDGSYKNIPQREFLARATLSYITPPLPWSHPPRPLPPVTLYFSHCPPLPSLKANTGRKQTRRQLTARATDRFQPVPPSSPLPSRAVDSGAKEAGGE